MKNLPQLPDSEFTIMQIVWEQPSPITINQITALAVPQRSWTVQTVYTLLARLVEKGFLYTTKQGRKERIYTPLVSQETYLNQETGWFFQKFHKNSVPRLMNALFKKATKEDLTEIETWLRENTEE
ncbi:MAG: BlaI/MecI/CopY family transcriptional regulator [Defluviitaleaceae bacterium]|nr:BlaI/MecI/CopY family transcriptional regulator [Defluviitaleaceae bacterium]MCL2240376.1 BlaI/MecI/CopY family transcriptional regulator [Defluviitaleaceae bacterium]